MSARMSQYIDSEVTRLVAHGASPIGRMTKSEFYLSLSAAIYPVVERDLRIIDVHSGNAYYVARCIASQVADKVYG